jgi:hypothetical protein
MKTSSKRLFGALSIAAPFIALPIILAVYAIVQFVVSSTASDQTFAGEDASLTVVVGNIVNTVLGFVGVLATLGIFVGIPLGIFLLVQASNEEKAALPPGGAPRDPRSGMGEASQVPLEITGWSWGGFGLGWIWGVFNNVWLSLFQFVGPLALPIAIYLGFKGRELAWKHKTWPSVEAFQATQKKWDFWGLLLFICTFGLFGIMGFVFVLAVMSNS